MTTPMRWADSDSDDSDSGYNVNEESSEAFKVEEAPDFSYNQQNQANTPTTIPSRDHYNNKYANENKGQRKHHHEQQTRNTKNYQKGGNDGYYGGGKNRSQHSNKNKNRGGAGPENWKQLAKASSRFSSGTWSK